MRKTCVGCYYYRYISRSTLLWGCHYCLDTGEPRGCDSENCDKKLLKVKKEGGLSHG
ncbi:hypothetical protein RBG61_02065 [Paludicola sp. MB14-C6]|uniref:hypothetical protein n=1 Tax=Paludihabitans sp. MB14-C6 TaxID=3070656 RepID=UPI0027DB3366|nr:hypothetical protein [Paludicola sp. MB14-C6]WMJ23477.1 hypothetical protein RBG61_02065 [Paludicola sp. MB14-C6]